MNKENWAAPAGLDTGLQVVRQETRSSSNGRECVDSKVRVALFRVSEGDRGYTSEQDPAT